MLKIIFKLFAGLNVYGLENLKDVKKPVIFASNHESYFDPFLIGSGLPWFSKFHPICYLADDSFLKT
ncbi:MAG: 1-acyl-sn-glycerol-3-phosphate acyltransferase, partial [Patescibacteria group bacterium]